MDKHLRRVLAIVDENQENICEGDYLEICDNLKEIRQINFRQRIKRGFRSIFKFAKYFVFLRVGTDTFNKLIKK